jgi:inorganic pyrophosphatase
MQKLTEIRIEPFDTQTHELNVIVETPRDSRNKYALNEQLGIFELKGVLTAGHSFPYDFGYIPQTRGGDDDPLDVLVLMEEPAFAGCLVKCRLIGGIKAEETEDGKTNRNDRLIAVASKSILHADVKKLSDLNKPVVEQIEHFFVSYNEAKGKRFDVLGHFTPAEARKLVKASVVE